MQEKAKLKAVCETAVAAVKEAYPEPEALDDVPPFDGAPRLPSSCWCATRPWTTRSPSRTCASASGRIFPWPPPGLRRRWPRPGVQENDRVTVTPARIKKLESRSFKTESGIEIRIPAELCSSDDAVEFIHSATGGLSLLIKDVLV